MIAGILFRNKPVFLEIMHSILERYSIFTKLTDQIDHSMEQRQVHLELLREQRLKSLLNTKSLDDMELLLYCIVSNTILPYNS